MKDFKGKVAVITGAGRGIGRGIALRCAREGMKVVLAGYSMDPLVKTEADLRALGAETLIVQTDVSDEAQVERLAEKSYERFGAVHLLVNNAGVAAPGSVLDISMNDWQWVMGVNFYGVLYGVRAFVPRMMAQGQAAHIVSTSSSSGLYPGGGSYGVSKHAVVVLTESLYGELAVKAPDITVSVYCPGWVSTDFDTVERSRPPRFKDETPAVDITPERRQRWRESLAGGLSIEESASVLFDGLREDKLYIGPIGFSEQDPDLKDWLRARTENILNERNPPRQE